MTSKLFNDIVDSLENLEIFRMKHNTQYTAHKHIKTQTNTDCGRHSLNRKYRQTVSIYTEFFPPNTITHNELKFIKSI